MVQGGFEKCANIALKGKDDPVEARKIFVNAQWALGGVGTGAPVSAFYLINLIYFICCPRFFLTVLYSFLCLVLF